MKNKTIILFTFLVITLSGCGQSCKDQYIIDRKHSMCSKLDMTVDERGNVIQTYGCATKSGEAFVDYYVRGSQLCYKSTFHY
jgi:hypothetical protein